MSLRDRGSDIEDSLPVELDGLETWGFADRLLAALLAGDDLDACLAAERARGMLPPGSLSDSVIDEVVPDLEALVAAGSDDRAPKSLAVNVRLPGGTTVVGTVPSVRGDTIHTVTYARMSPSSANYRVAAPTCAHRRVPRTGISRRSPWHVHRVAATGHRYRCPGPADSDCRAHNTQLARRTQTELPDSTPRPTSSRRSSTCTSFMREAPAALLQHIGCMGRGGDRQRPSASAAEKNGLPGSMRAVRTGSRSTFWCSAEWSLSRRFPGRREARRVGFWLGRIRADPAREMGSSALGGVDLTRAGWNQMKSVETRNSLLDPHNRGSRRGIRPLVRCLRPLPTGVTLLEASAGTGKTFTIAALVVATSQKAPTRTALGRDVHPNGNR